MRLQEEEEENQVIIQRKQTTHCLNVPPPCTRTTSSSPYMVFHHGEKECNQTFLSLLDGTYLVTSIPDFRGKHFFAFCDGWFLIKDTYTLSTCLFNPVSMETVELPEEDDTVTEVQFCILTTSPPDCVVMYFSVRDYGDILIMFCRPGDGKWITQSLSQPSIDNDEENADNSITMIDTVGCCKGKIFVCLDGATKLAVLDPNTTKRCSDGFFKVEISKMETIDPSMWYNSSWKNKLHLVESCGELFMVARTYWGCYGHEIQPLEVYKLNSSMTNWEKEEISLGVDRVFFLDATDTCSTSVSVSASNIGLIENHIFFLESNDTSFYTFNMKNGRISVHSLPCPNTLYTSLPQDFRPYWMLL